MLTRLFRYLILFCVLAIYQFFGSAQLAAQTSKPIVNDAALIPSLRLNFLGSPTVFNNGTGANKIQISIVNNDASREIKLLKDTKIIIYFTADEGQNNKGVIQNVAVNKRKCTFG